ncbi:acyltransferase [Arthrobacter sp. FW306-05-C]|uniref:acyltransferase family protein n=1 Tax=unclassified Arthrobacter TaxID=235627 RepID=UPI001EF09A01|nr:MULTISPECIES: acyltransferase [unclassified Arthrobacter]UKA67090.1 acyltransferase [Arthrobacter sp. FW306-05-C]UKA75723.1 acyltransferase [Arthrobacter sp. FW306-07-I]
MPSTASTAAAAMFDGPSSSANRQAETDGRRLHSLTGLRFVAAVAVALMHGLALYNLPIVDLGFIGVSFFFVLSGFVLTWAGAAEKGTGVFLRNRIAKLFPLSAATLAIAALVPVAQNSSAVSFLQSLTLTQAWWPWSASSFNPVAWSLSAEAFFYLLLPPLVSVMRRFSTKELVGTVIFLGVLQPVLGVACQLTLGAQVSHFITYNLPLYRLPEFVIGVALALLLKAGYVPPHSTQLSAAAFTTAGATLTLLVDLLHSIPWWISQTLMLPAIITLIWTAARRELAGNRDFLSNPVLVRLGDLSFAFYMVHYLVLGTFGLLVGRWAQGLPWWLVPPALLCAAAVAWVANRFIEKPCERAVRDIFRSRAGQQHGSPKNALPAPAIEHAFPALSETP